MRRILLVSVMGALSVTSTASVAPASGADPERHEHEGRPPTIDRPRALQEAMVALREIDQAIVRQDAVSGYSLAALASSGRIPDTCRESKGVRSDAPARAALNELRCAWFLAILEDCQPCLEASGIVDAPQPENWSPARWSGAQAWNDRLGQLPPRRRCHVLRQALVYAIAKANTVRPTWSIELHAVDEHALFVPDPAPGHFEDRRRAAWPLRYLYFTDPTFVPDRCVSVKLEGDFRYAEAMGTWEASFPGVFVPSPPGEFGRQALGNAYGMCGRSNNAHWVDRIWWITGYNETIGDPSQRIPIGRDNEALARDLESDPPKPDARYRAAWRADIDWDGFLGEPHPELCGEAGSHGPPPQQG